MRLLVIPLLLVLSACAPTPEAAKPPHLRRPEPPKTQPPPPERRPQVERPRGPERIPTPRPPTPPRGGSLDAQLRELHHRVSRLEHELRRP